jgi:hypothetical protein
MSSAEASVFGTVELVELILSHLSLRDLLAAQRVNFLFQQVIKKSPTTQKTRYLLADNSCDLRVAGYATNNPLYLQRFVQQACFYALQQVNKNVEYKGRDRFVKEHEKSFAEPEANWREMLLFQPPVKLALLKCLSSHYDDEYHYIRNENGVKMGDVVEHFQKKASKGARAEDLLSATVMRKVVWSVYDAGDGR